MECFLANHWWLQDVCCFLLHFPNLRQVSKMKPSLKRLCLRKKDVFTGCPRSNLAERIGYNFTRVLFWPHVDKVKMCFRNIHFFWKIFDFWKIVNIEYKNGKMGANFQSSIMVYWIEHWTDMLKVPGSNPSAA